MTIPLHPPAAWFERPPVIPLDRRLTITDEGRVFGYVKLRGSCHAGAPGCLDAPDESPSDFGFAHQGQTMTAEGSLIATANIGGGRHADLRADMLTAAAHYQEGIDNQLMRVRYGTDESGIWFSGALWPDADPLTVEHIRASPVSGDWRFVSYLRAHDFAGATLVNIPGYAMANAGDARTSPSMMKAIAASGAGMSVDVGGNIVAMYAPSESSFKETNMCVQCNGDHAIVAAAGVSTDAIRNAAMEAYSSGSGGEVAYDVQVLDVLIEPNWVIVMDGQVTYAHEWAVSEGGSVSLGEAVKVRSEWQPINETGGTMTASSSSVSAPLPATCACGEKPACDCGGDKVKALIASAQGEGEPAISFEQAVAMKFDEVFAQLAAHGTSIGTIEARRLAEQIME